MIVPLGKWPYSMWMLQRGQEVLLGGSGPGPTQKQWKMLLTSEDSGLKNQPANLVTYLRVILI